MVGISFAYPYFLLLLFLVPLFILIYFSSIFYNKKKAILFSNFEALERISNVEIFSKGISTLYINLAVIIFLSFAIAGTSISFDARSSVSSYVIMIDNSVSMKTSDVGASRLDVAKSLAKEFADILPVGTEIGVIQFSGEVNTLQRLDTSKLKTNLAIDSVNFGDVPGTNLYSAIITADGILGSSKSKSILIIGDGQFNLGDNQKVEDYAVKNNLIINAILVGTSDGGVTELGATSSADDSLFKTLSFDTQGTLFKTNSQGNLDKSLGTILNNKVKTVYMDLSLYLLIISIALILINWILYNFRFRAIP